VVDVIQNAPDLIDAEDDRKDLDRTRTKQVEARPEALEGVLEKELESGDSDRRGGAGATARAGWRAKKNRRNSCCSSGSCAMRCARHQ
jgi:hypothetical protein